MFRGSIVAIVTPFRDGKMDEKAFRDLIEFQINNGTDGIVPCGTTGESATLSHEEHERIIGLTIEAVNGRVPVIAGTGSKKTAEAARLAEIKNIVGIKEATGDLKQISDVISICPKDFLLLSGDDFTVYPTLAIGGHGVISVVANVAPKDMADLCDAYFAR